MPELLQNQTVLDSVIVYLPKKLRQTVFVIQQLVRYLAMMMNVLYRSRLLRIFSRLQEQDRTMFTVVALRRRCLYQ